MTAQVVLMNGLGVAIASDSAVTSGHKVMHGSEKIFELPAPHKAAVLVSGNAEFMFHPWEAVLSAWSGELPAQLQSMDDYRSSLQKFLRTMATQEGRLTVFESTYLMNTYLHGGTLETVNQILKNVLFPAFEQILEPEDFKYFCESPWDQEFRAKVSKLVTPKMVSDIEGQVDQTIAKRTEEFQALDGISYSQAGIWIKKYWDLFEDDLTPSSLDLTAWPDFPELDDMVWRIHSSFLVHPDDNYSYVALVGYGAGDLFPSASGSFIYGAIGGTLLKTSEGSVAPSGKPQHIFLGQTDTLDSLVRGDDRLLINTAIESTRNTLTEIADRLSTSDSDDVRSVREYITSTLDKPSLVEDMREVGYDKREQPFTKAIGMAPIQDLAEFASQLVSIQAAISALSQDIPTVGGSVDVAVITHRRGFKWIRQKN